MESGVAVEAPTVILRIHINRIVACAYTDNGVVLIVFVERCTIGDIVIFVIGAIGRTEGIFIISLIKANLELFFVPRGTHKPTYAVSLFVDAKLLT